MKPASHRDEARLTQGVKPASPEPLVNHQEPLAAKEPPQPKVDYFPIASALSEVCHMPFKANSGRLFREAKLLSTVTPPPTPELLKQHYNGNPESYWRKDDWRGKQGQHPSPANIRETWGQWSNRPQPKQERFIDYTP